MNPYEEIKPQLYVGEKSWVSYCICQLPATTDEDNFCSYISDEETHDIIFANFGVFDGHGGCFASQKLAYFLHEDVIRRYNLATQSRITFDKDKLDRTFCEAFRMAVSEIDIDIRRDSTAGSTQVSMFAFLFPDGSTRIYCPWIGDSRCVMFLAQNNKAYGFPMSIDHVPTLSREKNRIERRENIFWTGEPMEVIYENGQILDDKTVHSSTSDKRKVVAVLELPGQFKDIDIEDRSRNGSSNGLRDGIVCADVDNGAGADELKDGESMSQRPLQIHSQSFIERRSRPGGPKVGPWAVFGRYGTSLSMTRSIGDKYGPRSCVAVPDISATTIPAGKHARFVIGSDGLWDTVTVEMAQSIALSITNPKVAASKLVKLARVIRENKGMRMDDITCIVVDINPRDFTAPEEELAKCNCIIS